MVYWVLRYTHCKNGPKVVIYGSNDHFYGKSLEALGRWTVVRSALTVGWGGQSMTEVGSGIFLETVGRGGPGGFFLAHFGTGPRLPSSFIGAVHPPCNRT